MRTHRLLFAAVAALLLAACDQMTPEQEPQTDPEPTPPMASEPISPGCIYNVQRQPPASGYELLGVWKVVEPGGFGTTYTLTLGPGSWSIAGGPEHLHAGGDDISYWTYGERKDAFGSPQGKHLALIVTVAPLPIREWRLWVRSDGDGYCLEDGGFFGYMEVAE